MLDRVAEIDGLRVATHPQRYRLLCLLRRTEQTVGELVRRSGLAPNLVSHHLRELRRARLVWARQYGRERRYGLDVGAVASAVAAFAEALGAGASTDAAPTPRVLFVCRRNAGRSQIALAMFERAVGTAAVGDSAGSEPARAVHPVVRTALRELGVRVTRRPQRLTETMVSDADLVVDMGCGEAIPSVPGVRRVRWAVRDPEGQQLAEVRRIRDQIAHRVDSLVASLVPDGS